MPVDKEQKFKKEPTNMNYKLIRINKKISDT